MTLSATTQALSSLQELCLFFLFISSFLSFVRVWGEDFSLLTFYFLFFFCFYFFRLCPWFHANRIFRVSGCVSVRFRVLGRFRLAPLCFTRRRLLSSGGTRPARAGSRLCPGASDRRPARVGGGKKNTHRFLSPRAPFFPLRLLSKGCSRGGSAMRFELCEC